MENGPIHFPSIRVAMPLRQIYARLGYARGVTEVGPAEREMLARAMDDAAALVALRGAARIMAVAELGDAGVGLEDGTVFPSRALSRMLSGCTGVLLMGATAGQAVMDEIAACSRDNLARAVVLDAVASEMTDAALDWIMDYEGQILIRSARRVTKKRFSAGYGDLSLDSQEAMYELLRLDAAGITLTPSRIMVPEKSVTAIAGVLGMV